MGSGRSCVASLRAWVASMPATLCMVTSRCHIPLGVEPEQFYPFLKLSLQARNIVRLGGSFVFVDLDAVSSIGSDR
jgi:hypothetical protein